VMVGLCAIAILSACAITQEAQETQAPVFEVEPVPQPPAKPVPQPLVKPVPQPPAKPVPQPPAKPESRRLEDPPYLVHRVTWRNENLCLIAKWYTGRTENWKTIAKTNPKLDPRRIRLGTEIKIPAELLQTIVPMPRKFVQGSGSKPTKQ
jgi:nucleoid-associated protein YgaU